MIADFLPILVYCTSLIGSTVASYFILHSIMITQLPVYFDVFTFSEYLISWHFPLFILLVERIFNAQFIICSHNVT